MAGRSSDTSPEQALRASQDQARARPDPLREDRVYHGIKSADGKARILVEHVSFGLTEHDAVEAVRELHPPAYGGFSWGYNGGGPAEAARAVLADALEVADPDSFGELRSDFCFDIVTQLPTEWRLRRGAVLRWARGWCAEHDVTRLPHAVTQPPPANPFWPPATPDGEQPG